MSKSERQLSFDARWLVPLAVFAVAFALRLIGIGWGLPDARQHWSYHPDEPLVFSASQEIEPARFDFEPGFYNYGTLYLTLSRIGTFFAEGYGARLREDDPESLYRWMAGSHLAGRVISSLAGAGTALAVFLMFRRRFGMFGAASAATLVGIAPAHLVHSRFQTVDVTATLFLALSALYALKLLDEEEGLATKCALLAGVFAGLSASTKYTGILALLSVLAAVLIARRAEWLRLCGLSALGAVAAFLLTTPGILLNFGKFREDFGFELSKNAQGLVFAGTAPAYAYHVANLSIGIGWILATMGLVGLLVAAYLRRSWALVLLAFFLPYYVLIAQSDIKFLRYTFPLYVGIAGGFGWAMAAAHRRKGWASGVAAIGILGIGGETPMAGLRGAALTTSWMTGEDPRDSAAEYLRGRGVNVGLYKDPWFYTPPFYPDTGMPRALFARQGLEAMRSAAAPRVGKMQVEGGQVRFTLGDDTIEPALDYVAISSFEIGDEMRLAVRRDLMSEEQAAVDQFLALRKHLHDHYKLDRVFGARVVPLPHDLEYIRPTVWIWKRSDLP